MKLILAKLFFLPPWIWTVLIVLPMYIGEYFGIKGLFLASSLFLGIWEILLMNWISSKRESRNKKVFFMSQLICFWLIYSFGVYLLEFKGAFELPEGDSGVAILFGAIAVLGCWFLINAVILSQKYVEILTTNKREESDTINKMMAMFLVPYVGVYFIHRKTIQFEEMRISNKNS